MTDEAPERISERIDEIVRLLDTLKGRDLYAAKQMLAELSDLSEARMAEARREALEEAAKACECLLPEGGSAEPQDQADRLIDQVRRQDVEAIRALSDTPKEIEGNRNAS